MPAPVSGIQTLSMAPGFHRRPGMGVSTRDTPRSLFDEANSVSCSRRHSARARAWWARALFCAGNSRSHLGRTEM